VDYVFLLEAETALYCVGSAKERVPFEAIGAQPLITKDVRELAAVISACAVFIGNQSLPLALAAGLGKPRMVEESDRLPNVSFGGPDEAILTKLALENQASLQRLLERSNYQRSSLLTAATMAIG
jgi:ADP-heptose:LPS heptosyltransferase